jgi:hypothetical protein
MRDISKARLFYHELRWFQSYKQKPVKKLAWPQYFLNKRTWSPKSPDFAEVGRLRTPYLNSIGPSLKYTIFDKVSRGHRIPANRSPGLKGRDIGEPKTGTLHLDRQLVAHHAACGWAG